VAAQITATEEERLQILTEPEALKKRLQKEKLRPPFELFRTQIAPFDVLPFVKANHWCTLSFELRANEEDYDGILQTDPVRLVGMPQQMYFRRDAHLLKEQRARRSLQIMIPSARGEVPKEGYADMLRPGALRPDTTWPINLATLGPHQMLVLVLSRDATAKFAAWNRMWATIPTSVERDGGDVEKARYYRVVLPMESDKPAISSHPLTWSTISHVVWDGYSADNLSVAQQQALLDWVHWGGQLILSGGAGQAFSLYRESFLGPYLPAEATGESVPLVEEDFKPLSQSYPPPRVLTIVDEQSEPVRPATEESARRTVRNYQGPAPVRPAPKRPVHLSVLRPKPGAATIRLGEASPHFLAVESRVGRGRITLLALNPNEEALLAWPGLDTLVRRVILRRPEDPIGVRARPAGAGPGPDLPNYLAGADLTWYRITSRDLELPVALDAAKKPDTSEPEQPVEPKDAFDNLEMTGAADADSGVADWRDNAGLPRLARDLLEEASGITIPSSTFVMRVILAYLIAVVPLNWLVCRFVLRRREWAWLVVPLVALAFGVGVERVAAHDMGYDTASDEIDLLEIHGDYPRAHLTRLVSLYATGRSRFSISYPNNPTALALPMDIGRSIRGEEVSSATWQSSPLPALINYMVQPRSLSMFRAEEMLSLSGSIRLEGDAGHRRLINNSELQLRDAILLDSGGQEQHERWLGTIAAGGFADIDAAGAPVPERIQPDAGPDPNRFLKALRSAWGPREEDQGELRLVAWVSGPAGGQVIEPAIDRRRGFTAVIVHVKSGSPPSPDGPRYNLMASRDPALEARVRRALAPQPPRPTFSGNRSGRVRPGLRARGMQRATGSPAVK
jgi:hypothetical protein